MHRLLVFGVLALLATASPARAQTIDDLKHSLALQQAEIDRLQVALNAKLGPQNVAGYIDLALSDPAGGVLLVGWALQCGQQPPIAQVMIDGVIADNLFLAPYPRADVTAVYSAYCASLGGLLTDVGATALIDVSHYAPGQHTLALRLRASNGFETMSNIATFTK